MSLAQWALWGVCLALLGALVVLSRGPVRLLFAAGFVADVVVRIGQVFVLEGAAHPRAFHAPIAYRLETGMITMWPIAVCALAWWTFVPRARRISLPVLIAAWAIVNVAIAALVPFKPAPTKRAFHAVELASVALGALAVMMGWERRRERPATVAFVVLAAELVVATVGPYAADPFKDWSPAVAVYAFTFGVLVVMHSRWSRED